MELHASPTRASYMISERAASSSAQEVISDSNVGIRCCDSTCLQHMTDALGSLQRQVCETKHKLSVFVRCRPSIAVSSLTLSWSFAQTSFGLMPWCVLVRNWSLSKCRFNRICSVGWHETKYLHPSKETKNNNNDTLNLQHVGRVAEPCSVQVKFSLRASLVCWVQGMQIGLRRIVQAIWSPPASIAFHYYIDPEFNHISNGIWGRFIIFPHSEMLLHVANLQ